MFNVIRIPTKFNKPISRLSDKDKVRLFNSLMSIGDGNKVVQSDDSVGDILSLIYSEWMNMEVRNGYKRDEHHLLSEGSIQPCPSDSGHRVEYNRIEYNIIEDNRLEDSVASQPNEYLESIKYLKEYEIGNELPEYAEKYEQEWIKFCYYWSEKGKTGKIRAEGEKTFDIRRRFATWLSRKKETSAYKPDTKPLHPNPACRF